jgi:hypothetical protein
LRKLDLLVEFFSNLLLLARLCAIAQSTFVWDYQFKSGNAIWSSRLTLGSASSDAADRGGRYTRVLEAQRCFREGTRQAKKEESDERQRDLDLDSGVGALFISTE